MCSARTICWYEVGRDYILTIFHERDFQLVLMVTLCLHYPYFKIQKQIKDPVQCYTVN